MQTIKEVRTCYGTMLREKMGDEASCILASLQLSDFADPRVDDVLVWLDLVVWPKCQQEKEEDQGEELPEA